MTHKEKWTTESNSQLNGNAVRRLINEKENVNDMTVRVLYAEDNEDACKMMSHLLKLSAIEVTSVKTISEAWEMAKSNKFDLYLLDSIFPDGDGLELCRRLHEYAPYIPIIIYSGDGLLSHQKKGLEAGAKAYLVKPDLDSLTLNIQQLTDRA